MKPLGSGVITIVKSRRGERWLATGDRSDARVWGKELVVESARACFDVVG